MATKTMPLPSTQSRQPSQSHQGTQPRQGPATRQFSVFERPDSPIMPAPAPAAGGSAASPSFEHPATLRGSTTHFTVYYDPALGAAGPTLADGVIARCESDYQAVSAIFGGIQIPHFNIIVASGIGGGAYHDNCSATDLYCDGAGGVSAAFVNFLVVAEEVEVFEAVQNRGWACGYSNGEGLSRTLATLLYPAQLNGFTSAANWLNAAGRPDFVDSNDNTDRNYVSIGCSVLFLNYLRSQLGYSWAQITQAAGNTLNNVYENLTRSLNGFAQFSADLQSRFPAGTPASVPNDNPFPINMIDIKNILIDTAQNAPAAAYLNGLTFIGWSGTDAAHHLNVMSSAHRTVWGSKVTLGDTSPNGCSLCVFNNRLYLAWTGTGNSQINLMSSGDGITWGNKVTLADTCIGRPSLAAHNGQLVLAWAGTDSAHHINTITSQDGAHWGNKHTLGDTASDSPAIASFANRLFLAWSGTDNPHHVNVMSSGDFGASWQNKVTLNETSIAAPALLTSGNQLLLSWAGTDSGHHLNILRSTDGVTFSQKVTSPETSNNAPTLALAYGAPALYWTGTDSHLNLLSI